MKSIASRTLSLLRNPLCLLLAAALVAPVSCLAARYTNFNVAIYIPVGVVQSLANPDTLRAQWDLISSQLKVDKVYIEVQRNRDLATDESLEAIKKFFLDHGVRVAGGMALADNEHSRQFHSFCYTDPNDRRFVKQAAELAARHFDEVIQDDFFFVTTKNDSDVKAKGNRSWTEFRLALMDDAAKNLVVGPARAINPRIKMVIKFPNWYEHFQGLGYDLDNEPRIFDGIYTGTETRDPVMSEQHLQQYESYLIYRYFENIKPGGNGGGWVDTFGVRDVDRYAEQLWDTLFAKAPEITLFNWALLTQRIHPGERAAWQNLHTSFDYNQMLQSCAASVPGSEPTMARVAGYSLEQVDSFAGSLGKPIGIASYKPLQSTGEDFLHNYFGMIGLPINLFPTFPTNAPMVLLTESAACDPAIVAKIKNQLRSGKSVCITSGLLRALQGKGIEDIVELRYTTRKLLARQFPAGIGPGADASLGPDQEPGILFPEIEFLTNDAWAVVRALADGGGVPLLILDRYSKGILYVWNIPDNFNDLYRLPPSIVTAIKDYLMPGFPIRLDSPSQVTLFAYDNNTCIVQSFLPAEADVKVSVSGGSASLRNLVTGAAVSARAETPAWGRPRQDEPRAAFDLHLLPHSYTVLRVEK